MGFFSPRYSKGRYLGIWYKKVSTGTVVWVAKREASVSDASGVLRMKIGRNFVTGFDRHLSSWKSEEDPAPGLLQRSIWNESKNDTDVFSTSQTDNCSVYDYCGSHASCSTDESPPCNCLEGFVQRPASPGDLVPVWSYGCIRRTLWCVMVEIDFSRNPDNKNTRHVEILG
ncbi:hypothetical protein V6N13_049692 [Hibiscus sabdariffa]|uniref:S-locus glycoprotein domain-containing protein n=1 Tax=Hibiscus sabdariffa TaxID=183260 RepID=A0ABR2QWG8_9ROSI